MKVFTCKQCGKKFKDYFSNKRVFCCSACRNRFHKPHKGHKHSDKSKRKMSKAHKGKHHSPKTEFKKGQNPPHKGKKLPQISGNKHWNWKGGSFETKSGYIMVKKPNHPNCQGRGYIFEHRLEMEKKIGRYLKKGEVVHHINGKRTDNRIENLKLYTNSKHSQMKKKKQWRDGKR